MTLVEFLGALKETPRNWHSRGILLRNESRDCPITAVYADKFRRDCHPFQWERAARELGIRRSTAQRIVIAADSLFEAPALRGRLNKACKVAQ